MSLHDHDRLLIYDSRTSLDRDVGHDPAALKSAC